MCTFFISTFKKNESPRANVTFGTLCCNYAVNNHRNASAVLAGAAGNLIISFAEFALSCIWVLDWCCFLTTDASC